MKTKHTSGPWSLGATINLRHCILDADGNYIALTKGNYELEKQANATLIAAAPEMFEALETCLKLLDEAHDLYGFRNAVFTNELSKLIKKARGE